MAAYQDGLAQFERAEAQILGVSINSEARNKSFAEKLGLTIPLLCDTERKVSRLYKVLNFFRIANRVTYVIDKEGIIRHVDAGRAAAFPYGALRAVQALAEPASPRTS